MLELFTFSAILAKNVQSERVSKLIARKKELEKAQKNVELQDKLLYSSTHHNISGLPNRAYMEGWLDNHLRQSPDQETTLVFIYLSRLHEIGRTLGRQTGDDTLKAFGHKLNQLARSLAYIVPVQEENDFYVGSMEGATHALIVKSPTNDRLISDIGALQRSINEPLDINELSIEPGVQVSLVEAPTNGMNASQLVR